MGDNSFMGKFKRIYAFCKDSYYELPQMHQKTMKIMIIATLFNFGAGIFSIITAIMNLIKFFGK